MTLSDDKGKLAELLMAYSLSPTVLHYRTPDKTPDIILSELKSKLHPDLVFNTRAHAEDASTILLNKMFTDSRVANTDADATVYWSSNPNDHFRITNTEDPNASADIIIKSSLGYIGISMKVGKQRYPCLGNFGMSKLGEYVDGFDLTDLTDWYHETIVGIGLNGTQAQNKECIALDKEKCLKAHGFGNILLKNVSHRMWQNLKTLSADALFTLTMDMIAPKTEIPHYLVYTRHKDENASRVTHLIEDMRRLTETTLENYTDYRINDKASESTITSIVATDVRDGSTRTILRLRSKFSSGPCTSLKLNVTAPVIFGKK